jgi:hypothetical protein
MSMLKVWSEDECLYLDYENEDEFFLIPETSKLPLPIVPRRPHPRVNLTQKDLGERVLVFGDKRGILRYIGPTHFESGEWCGVELDLPEGKNNGQISGTDYFHCLPNHGLFVPSHCVELLKDIQPKRFSLCLRDIESGSSTSSSLAENESDLPTSFDEGRSYLQFKARHRKKLLNCGSEMKSMQAKHQRPKTARSGGSGASNSANNSGNRLPVTRIPVPEARRSSPSVSRRKRHVAGSESVKKNEMTDILDPNVKSKPVLPSGGAGNTFFFFFLKQKNILW